MASSEGGLWLEFHVDPEWAEELHSARLKALPLTTQKASDVHLTVLYLGKGGPGAAAQGPGGGGGGERGGGQGAVGRGCRAPPQKGFVRLLLERGAHRNLVAARGADDRRRLCGARAL